jgi:hypothetical protein
MEKQDPVEVAPNIYKVPLENDRVRVLDIHMQPGANRHSTRILRTFSIWLELEAGQAMWSDGVTHEPENTGTTEMHAVAIEFKE